MNSAAPGWYPDPKDPSQLRWFDGRFWTDRQGPFVRLPGRFVIDHVGKFLEPVAPEHDAFKALLRQAAR